MTTTRHRRGPLLAQVTDPEGRRWSVWRRLAPWRPRSPDLVLSTALEAGALPDVDVLYEVVRGILIVAIACALAVVELVALAVAWLPWWVVVRLTHRPVHLELYRDRVWSRTRRADADDVDRVVDAVAHAIETGTLDPVRRPSGPRRTGSRT